MSVVGRTLLRPTHAQAEELRKWLVRMEEEGLNQFGSYSEAASAASVALGFKINGPSVRTASLKVNVPINCVMSEQDAAELTRLVREIYGTQKTCDDTLPEVYKNLRGVTKVKFTVYYLSAIASRLGLKFKSEQQIPPAQLKIPFDAAQQNKQISADIRKPAGCGSSSVGCGKPTKQILPQLSNMEDARLMALRALCDNSIAIAALVGELGLGNTRGK